MAEQSRFCTTCGKTLTEARPFCKYCGARTAIKPSSPVVVTAATGEKLMSDNPAKGENVSSSQITPTSIGTSDVRQVNMNISSGRGTENAWQCTNNHKNPEDFEFCSQCGEQRSLAAIVCSKCGHVLAPAETFCGKCGTSRVLRSLAEARPVSSPSRSERANSPPSFATAASLPISVAPQSSSKAGGIIGLLAGIFAVFAAVSTLLIGGIGSALNTSNSLMVVWLGWGGILFSFLTIAFGAVGLFKAKVGGWGLIVCSIAGAVLGGTFVAICMILSFVGGIVCLVGARSTGTSPKPSRARLAILVSIAVVLAILLVADHLPLADGTFTSGGPSESASPQSLDTSPSARAESPLQVSPSRIFADYEANEVAADVQYKGRLLALTGVVEQVGKDLLDQPYLTLETGNPVFNVQCLFPHSSEPELAGLVKGQRITVEGRGKGKLGDVLIDACRIVAEH